LSGKQHQEQVPLAKDVDHMIGAEERFRFAMTRQ